MAGGCVVVDSQAHITRDQKHFKVTGAPELKLTTFDGAIEVRSGGDAGSVLVEIEKRGPTQESIDQLQIDTKQDGNRIEIDVKKPEHQVVFFGIGTDDAVGEARRDDAARGNADGQERRRIDPRGRHQRAARPAHRRRQRPRRAASAAS